MNNTVIQYSPAYTYVTVQQVHAFYEGDKPRRRSGVQGIAEARARLHPLLHNRAISHQYDLWLLQES